MRRIVVVALLLALCGCAAPAENGGESAVPFPTPELAAVTAAQAAQAVVDSQGDLVGLTPLEEEDQDFYLAELYGLEEDLWTDAAVYAAPGVDAREVAVIRLSGMDAVESVRTALEEYRQSRLGDFFGYAPDQAALVSGGGVACVDDYAALLICENLDAAADALTACLWGEIPPEPAPATGPPAAGTPESAAAEPPAEETAEPPETPGPAETAESASASTPVPTPEPAPTPAPVDQALNPGLDISGFVPFNPPNEFDMSLYDTFAIRAAYASGDASGLSEKDAAILERCREALEACVTPGMTAFEKELGLHYWLIEQCEYDESVHNPWSPQGREENTNPYGVLIGGYGICLGYATTFQLLMDLSGVECITVVGASSGSTGDHAWNMVRLEGEWYCVDPTWNDPVGDLSHTGKAVLWQIHHRYFNVTSDYMRQTNHQWDYLNVPEASATRFFWDGIGALPA